MKIYTSAIAFFLVCYFTSADGIFFKFPKFTIPKFKFPTIKTPTIPFTTMTPITTKKSITTSTTTTNPTTTISTTPPTTIEPPIPTTPHPDDETIAICLEEMRDCPWTETELVEKIVERQNVDTEAEFSGEGDPVGPAVDPDPLKPKPDISGTVKPGFPFEAKQIPSTGVPKKCLPFGMKLSSTKEYKIGCTAYLSDSSLKYYYQRRNAMIGCFKCRNLCEVGGAIQYL